MHPLQGAIRILKGMYMFWMYVVFGTCIGLGIIFILPPVWLLEKLRGPATDRMQTLFRLFFRFWLGLLNLGGLLKTCQTKQTIPPGTFIIVANHPGLFDVLVLIRDIPKLSVLVKSALVKELPLAHMFRKAGYVVAPSESAFGALETLQSALAMVNAGNSFLIFPEGTRSPKGDLRRFKAGAFKLAQKAGVPILPVLVKNNPPFLPKEERWYYPPYSKCDIELEFWDPIPPPPEGTERKAALQLQRRYQKALGLDKKKKQLTTSR